MTPRLAAHLVVSALIRQVEQAGGHAMVLHKGDRTSGSILIQAIEKNKEIALFEATTNREGQVTFTPCGPNNPKDPADFSAYLDRRTRVDSDLWIIELDTADVERFVSEQIF